MGDAYLTMDTFSTQGYQFTISDFLTSCRNFAIFVQTTFSPWRHLMAKKLDPAELVSFKELLMANSIMADAVVQLMIDKGFITQEEFFSKLKEVQAAYKARQNNSEL
jgi:hypothetical protein